MNNYVLKLKKLSNQLESIAYVLIEEDNVLYLTTNIDQDYDGPLSTLSGRLQTELVSLTDVVALLLRYKNCLESRNEVID